MTVTTMEELKLGNLRPTPISLELADRTRVKPVGVLDDVIVTLASWEFPSRLYGDTTKAYGGPPHDFG